jgi:hypothetical protein
MAGAWSMIEDLWRGTVARARKLPGPVSDVLDRKRRDRLSTSAASRHRHNPDH